MQNLLSKHKSYFIFYEILNICTRTIKKDYLSCLKSTSFGPINCNNFECNCIYEYNNKTHLGQNNMSETIADYNFQMDFLEGKLFYFD